MNKIIHVLLYLVCSPVFLTAQPKIERSEPFDEPATVSYSKVLLLKSGNTAFITFDGDGIDVSLYNKERKVITTANLSSNKWNDESKKATAISGAYEINGEIVVFVQQSSEKSPTLYRMRISETTAKLVKEDVIGSTDHRKKFFGDDFRSHLYVVKDTRSDCYAVIYYDNVEGSANEALKVIHFDGSHNVISTGRLTFTGKKTDDFLYLDAVVNENKNVFIATYYDAPENESSHIYLSQLKVGETALTSKALDFTEDFKESTAQLIYNNNTNALQLLINAYSKSKRFKGTKVYLSFLAFISPDNLGVTGVKEISNAMITEYGRNNLALESDYSGLPQEMVIKGNKTIVVSEGMTSVIYVSKSGGTSIVATTMGDIGITEMSASATEERAYLLPRTMSASGDIKSLYLKDIGKGTWENRRSERLHGSSVQGYQFRYIVGEKSDYVVFNDYFKNIENVDKDKFRKSDWKESKINATYCVLRNGNVSKTFLFDKPTSKKNKNTCYMAAADQNDQGVFATVMVSKKGKHREARIAWVSFE